VSALVNRPLSVLAELVGPARQAQVIDDCGAEALSADDAAPRRERRYATVLTATGDAVPTSHTLRRLRTGSASCEDATRCAK
jgi:hypothetical protein